MSDFLFNVARGRPHEMHRIVNDNVLANAALILVVLAEAGIESDDVLRDYATLSALLAGASNEPTNSGYARKTLTDADIAGATIDQTNDLVRLTYPNQTWTTVASGDSWAKLLTCIDYDTTAGTDADIIPITAQDMLINGAYVIPTGVNIQWSIPSGYYLSAS